MQCISVFVFQSFSRCIDLNGELVWAFLIIYWTLKSENPEGERVKTHYIGTTTHLERNSHFGHMVFVVFPRYQSDNFVLWPLLLRIHNPYTIYSSHNLNMKKGVKISKIQASKSTQYKSQTLKNFVLYTFGICQNWNK